MELEPVNRILHGVMVGIAFWVGYQFRPTFDHWIEKFLAKRDKLKVR